MHSDAIGDKGIWGESGINSENVAMSATETITSNPRILGVDPLVEDGIGEEDMLTLVLPYVHSAKEGVLRLGSILEEYGTYEMNGIAFSDKAEVWYLETYGGHQWAAVRIPDDAYVVAPNRTNIDEFDFDSDDTLSAPGLKESIEKHHLIPIMTNTTSATSLAARRSRIRVIIIRGPGTSKSISMPNCHMVRKNRNFLSFVMQSAGFRSKTSSGY